VVSTAFIRDFLIGEADIASFSCYSKPPASAGGAFTLLLGTENVFTSEADRMAYSYDEAVLTPVVPALVVRPMEEKFLGKAVNLAYENDMPITVRGSGTNLMVHASEFPIRQSRRLRKQDS
jgi:UDP-N-acetylenolpyruvoylglucosamine reductase